MNINKTANMIASVLLENRDNMPKPVHNKLVLDMMQELARANRQFDYKQFEEAAGFWSGLTK